MGKAESPFSHVPIPNTDGTYPAVSSTTQIDERPRSPFSDVQIPYLDGTYPEDGSDGAAGLAPAQESWGDEDNGVLADASDALFNTFERRAIELAKQLELVDTSGVAQIPSERRWLQSGDQRRSYVNTMSFDEIASKAAGWKLHLNFDADNPTARTTVETFLDALKKHGAVTAFKIGKGGGKESDAPGKEATVYVGHRDKAAIVASSLEETLSSVLEAPEGDALDDDIPFTGRVMGRFGIKNVDQAFHQYGGKGHPVLAEDMGLAAMPPYSVVGSHEREELFRQSNEAADALLKARYDTFYTGS